MLTSIASAFTQQKVRKFVAMTGEITLRGRVLPVGGIKEKILAAKRAGIKEIILSADNRKDIEDIDVRYTKGMRFTYVTEMIEVVQHALLKEKVANALKVAPPVRASRCSVLNQRVPCLWKRLLPSGAAAHGTALWAMRSAGRRGRYWSSKR
jgi:predicted ATP-dependent protease